MREISCSFLEKKWPQSKRREDLRSPSTSVRKDAAVIVIKKAKS
jgi:hypothetical protein